MRRRLLGFSVGVAAVAAITAQLLVPSLHRSDSETSAYGYPLVTIPGRWASESGSNLDTLIESHPVVFIGRVEARTGQTKRGGDSLVGSLPTSQFQVSITKSLTNAISGEKATVHQAGGLVQLGTGEPAYLTVESDVPLVQGETYLFFASHSPAEPGQFTTSPFSRLKLDRNERFYAAHPWSGTPAMAALSGLTQSEVARVIRSIGTTGTGGGTE